MRQRLILWVPVETGVDALEAALAGGDVAAVVVQPDARQIGDLVACAQSAAAAALLRWTADTGRPWPARHGADGLHVSGVLTARADVVRTRPDGAIVGAAADSRHDAMVLGEVGADYMWFGETNALARSGLALCAWWQEMFEVPAVMAGPSDLPSVAEMIATGAEFIALGDVFQDACDVRARVAAVDALLAERQDPVNARGSR